VEKELQYEIVPSHPGTPNQLKLLAAFVHQIVVVLMRISVMDVP
jgi:hypothetical protein